MLKILLTLSLPLTVLISPALNAQIANTLNTPTTITFGTTTTPVGMIDTSGNLTTQGSVSTGTGGTTPGSVDFLGGTGGSLTLTAPSAFTGSINQTWTFPLGALPSGYSFLQLNSTGANGAMNYATLTSPSGSGITITPSSGSYVFSLSSSLNLGPVGMSVINDSATNPILGLSSSGSGNYVTIANDTTSSGPTVRADGTPAAIPLQLADKGGAGVLLESNGGLALKVKSTSALPTQWVRIDATPSLSTFAGGIGTQILASNAGGTSDISLALKAQGNGYVAMQSNVDSASAYAFEHPADTSGVTKGLLVVISSITGNAVTPSVSTTSRPIIGVALNTATSGPAVIATSGRVNCTFELTPPVTPGHYVQLSASTGKCQDAGPTYSSSVQLIGTVLDTSGNIILRLGN